ncbi:VCBS repeat-containing protein [Chitinophaga rhizosphaerae]|uniref:VCBS repeat-containing protein n=1 Tax=Chitinophaga rhizosphaerae TaxID=1864947 RepID=UPI000F7FEAC9|nr:VCBS repeat-containing protein [Chitinophaga rhizosphaerae]
MRRFRINNICWLAGYIAIGCAACGGPEKDRPAAPVLFDLLPASETGVAFNDSLTEGLNTNVLMYEYFYNGGGVAVGDVDNDGLQDIYFTGNMVDNRLYRNNGHMRFEDITGSAGVAGRPGPWKTGAVMADVNGDNRLDIYVCYSGKVNGMKRIPQLFINKGPDQSGKPVFRDEAALFGLADSVFGTQAYFFDYDKDGDLDLLQANHNPRRLDNLDDASIAAILRQQDPASGTRLLRNDNGRFTDATARSGIASSPLSYNLGAGIADVNGDGWPDIYLSNDYLVPDYLYLNNGDGTFTDQLASRIGHTSQFSMGNDIADVNNDGWPDIITLDMLPEDNLRQKLLFAPDNYEEFDMLVRAGFHRQYMRNMLQLNNGNGSFSETGQLAGISNTDWSWAPLLADYDNDGWKDLFVTNGYVRDYTNMDFLKYMTDFLQQKRKQVYREDLFKLVKEIPASNVVNYIFRNNGDATFTNMQQQWGCNVPSNSNGAAYADLDNDGDLDLVVNNINQPAFIYRNNAEKQANGWLQVKLEGAAGNTQGVGTKVAVCTGDQWQYLEQMPARGFQSSVSPVLHFGLGKATGADSLWVRWPDGRMQFFGAVKSGQILVLKQSAARETPATAVAEPRTIFREDVSPIAYEAALNNINDFKRQPLLINPLSFFGPCMTKGDVNGDGREDIFIGGGGGKAGALFLQNPDGSFLRRPQPALEADNRYEDAGAVCFDADGNGTADLYIASGGYHNFLPEDTLLQDRLYLNDGKGNFRKAAGALPEMLAATGCVQTADVNGDGFPDIFAGGRNVPGRYPEIPESFLLVNDGKGHFSNQTATLAAPLQRAGMVTDAAFTDLNNDHRPDLVIVGEWMPVSVYINQNGRLEVRTEQYFGKKFTGWWNRLSVADYNGDGRQDIIVGNMGLNSQCRADETHPAELYSKDYDDNGSVDPVFCFYLQGKSWPFITRDELFDQLSIMRTRFGTYRAYAEAGYNDIFRPEERTGAAKLTANYLETVYFESTANGTFAQKRLPLQAQYSPVFTITDLDFDQDGDPDILLCGNINQARLRLGSSDASYGMLLENDGKGNFTYVPQAKSGLRVRGDVRSVLRLNDRLFFGINQQPVISCKINGK